jgi:hypothetical protein
LAISPAPARERRAQRCIRSHNPVDSQSNQLHTKYLAMTKAHVTVDHDHIKTWAETRGGHPAVVSGTGEPGILRVDFDPPDEKLEQIDWDRFFDTFEQRSLAFLYQDRTSDGKLSRFSKFIDRSSTEAADLSQVPDNELDKNRQDQRNTSNKGRGKSH